MNTRPYGTERRKREWPLHHCRRASVDLAVLCGLPSQQEMCAVPESERSETMNSEFDRIEKGIHEGDSLDDSTAREPSERGPRRPREAREKWPRGALRPPGS